MKNIVSYIQEDQRTFVESPLNPVDSLVLSTLAYFNFETITFIEPASPQRVLIHDIIALSSWRKLTSGSWLEDAKDTRAFLHALMASRRYRNLAVSFYVNECSDIVEKQFSAVTFFSGAPSDLPDEFAYLAFRGTDGSLAGWKEDFNLCFKSVIPSQQTAVSYLSGVASACTCPLAIGGHSKGGNLAEYAALVIHEKVFARFIGIFNHDGPSFLEVPSPRIDDPRFIALLDKTVPESSAFGMILERRADFRVVQSSALSVFQHEPFSWKIKEEDFLCQDNLNATAVLFDNALDTWLRSKSTAERELFIGTIYDLLSSTEASSWAEFQDKLFANLRTFAGTGSRLDPETRRFIGNTLRSLVPILRKETLRRIKASPRPGQNTQNESYASRQITTEEFSDDGCLADTND